MVLAHVLFYPAERVVVVGSENAEMVDDSNYGQNDNNGQGDISGGRGGGGSGGTGDVEDNGGIEIRWKWSWRWWDWGGSCNTIFTEFLPPYFTLFGTLSFVP